MVEVCTLLATVRATLLPRTPVRVFNENLSAAVIGHLVRGWEKAWVPSHWRLSN